MNMLSEIKIIDFKKQQAISSERERIKRIIKDVCNTDDEQEKDFFCKYRIEQELLKRQK